ncbi:Copia protein [Cucumis melo var. makuwa]|uniref:Copia protein n=1 Tax=Cucumis melo var. makuwa TaxID=1194695 RepID=A0A5D3D8I1_CUCMM|nr:Copia protein [Cucumis melo var. makuwa]
MTLQGRHKFGFLTVWNNILTSPYCMSQKIDLCREIAWNCPNDGIQYSQIEVVDKIYVFLAGHNPKFDIVHGHLLGQIPIPSLMEVCSEVYLEEDRTSAMSSMTPLPLILLSSMQGSLIMTVRGTMGNQSLSVSIARNSSIPRAVLEVTLLSFEGLNNIESLFPHNHTSQPNLSLLFKVMFEDHPRCLGAQLMFIAMALIKLNSLLEQRDPCLLGIIYIYAATNVSTHLHVEKGSVDEVVTNKEDRTDENEDIAQDTKNKTKQDHQRNINEYDPSIYLLIAEERNESPRKEQDLGFLHTSQRTLDRGSKWVFALKYIADGTLDRHKVRSRDGMTVCERKSTLDLLAETDMMGCHHADTPIEFNAKLKNLGSGRLTEDVLRPILTLTVQGLLLIENPPRDIASLCGAILLLGEVRSKEMWLKAALKLNTRL